LLERYELAKASNWWNAAFGAPLATPSICSTDEPHPGTAQQLDTLWPVSEWPLGSLWVYEKQASG